MKKTYHFEMQESNVWWADVTVDLEKEELLDEDGNVDEDALETWLQETACEAFLDPKDVDNYDEETTSRDFEWEEIGEEQ